MYRSVGIIINHELKSRFLISLCYIRNDGYVHVDCFAVLSRNDGPPQFP